MKVAATFANPAFGKSVRNFTPLGNPGPPMMHGTYIISSQNHNNFAIELSTCNCVNSSKSTKNSINKIPYVAKFFFYSFFFLWGREHKIYKPLTGLHVWEVRTSGSPAEFKMGSPVLAFRFTMSSALPWSAVIKKIPFTSSTASSIICKHFQYT